VPLVTRIRKHRGEATFGVISLDTTMYVRPGQVKQTDRVVPVDRIDDAQLLDLAVTYPEEYEETARKRGLDLALRPEQFAALSTAEAIRVVKECGSEAILARYFQTELERAPRRPKVMKAFLDRGFDPETYEEDDQEEPEGEDVGGEGEDL
jgi:hypothetical protein